MTDHLGELDVDTIISETALAVAQSTMYNAMLAAGMNQAEVARRMDVPPPMITRILSGDWNLTVKTLARFLEATGHELVIKAKPRKGPEGAMAAFKSQAQAERCKRLVAEGKMKAEDYEKHLAETGGEEGVAKLPKRVGG